MRIQLLECAFPPALLQGPTFWRCDVMRGSCNGFLTEITLTPVANRWEWKIMWWWRWWSLIVNERQSGWFVQNHFAGDFQGPGSCPADTKSTPCTNIIEMNTVSDSYPFDEDSTYPTGDIRLAHHGVFTCLKWFTYISSCQYMAYAWINAFATRLVCLAAVQYRWRSTQ